MTPEREAELAEFRRDLHAHPEPGAQTSRTARRIAERLEAAGLDVTRGVGGHGVVATLARGPGPAIALRADMDALPIREATNLPHASRTSGAFHGCGHDGHSAMLLGAALALAEAPPPAGTVHFLFQPDEETGAGAQAMIDDGLFDRFPVDAIYGLHNMPGLPAGTVAAPGGPFMAFEDNFVLRLTGLGGHAASPHRGRDPVPALGALLSQVQSVVARNLDPAEAAVVSVTGIETDGARNVIPTTITVTGDSRGYSDAVRETIRARLSELTRHIAAAHGLEAETAFDASFVPLVNAPAHAARALAAADAAGLATEPQYPRWTASEDFARFLAHVPGAFALIGNGTEGPHAAPLHNPGYDFNDAALAPGVAFWTALARRALAEGTGSETETRGFGGIR